MSKYEQKEGRQALLRETLALFGQIQHPETKRWPF
jgi:hypothetical protein